MTQLSTSDFPWDKKEITFVDWIVCVDVVMLIVFGAFIVDLYGDGGCASCMLYNPDVKWGLQGIYHTPEYYCVWIKDRSLEEINKTECHEVAHHLAYTQYGHFCLSENVKQKRNNNLENLSRYDEGFV